MTRRRTIKKLYKKLKESQELDVCLTGPGFVEIKFYLKYHQQCTQVLVQDLPPSTFTLATLPANPSNLPNSSNISNLSNPSNVPNLSSLPNFIKSQLQAQKIDTDDCRSSVQVSAVLQCAIRHLATKPIQASSFPTLFRWHHPDTRRSYYLFAYLADEMASYTYTADELLGLRGSSSSQILLDKVKMNPDLGGVIRARGSNTQTGNNTLLRRQKKIKEEVLSSTNSEEHIIFQGKKQLPRPSINNGNLSSGNVYGEMEWKYRGRTESERISNEPLSAPTGLDAQQNEGFQRFFKAVVSPTHVRVTAGGRIVPNTRASTSPTAKWDKGHGAFEDDTADSQAKQPPTESTAGHSSQRDQPPTHAIHPMMMHPMMSPMYPGYPPMFSPMGAAMPFYPIHNGMPLPYAFPHPPTTMASMPQNPAPEVQKQEKQDDEAAGTAKTEHDQEPKKPKPAPIKISPPEQFDQTRPYFYNGNVIYPGMGPMPLQGQGTPLTPSPYMPQGFVNPAIARAGSFAQPSPLASMHSPHGLPTPGLVPQMSATSVGAPGSQQFAQTAPKSAAKSASATTPSATKPPITSIKPSEITKSQLASLRSQLKYYEDQMQYNKHQIDEKATQEQIQTIRKLIDQFEHNFSMQLNFETSYYQGGAKKAEGSAGPDAAPCQTPSRAPSIMENAHDARSQSGSIRSAKQTTPALSHTQSLDHIRLRSLKDMRQRAGINSSKGNDTNAALDALEAHLKQSKQARTFDPIKKFSLPTGAAMAPAFEPRGPPSLTPHSDVGSITDATQVSDTPWDMSNLLPLSQPGLWAAMNPSGHGVTSGRHTSDAETAAQSSFGSSTSPYLIGKLPQGMTPLTAHATDYLYSRELTDDEKRARHVYWGQVTSKGLGLPKFDGKDFYPASPVKVAGKVDAEPKSKLRQIPTGRPEVDYSFNMPKKPEDPFRINRDTGSIRSGKSGVRASHAVPIINPDTLSQENMKTTPKATTGPDLHGNAGSDKQQGSMRGTSVQSSPTKTPTGSVSEKKPTSLNRRALERSSKGSSNDLWQSMLKKGSTSGTAVPSAVSSTTATGYLPQHFGNAAASLSPTVTNVNGPQARGLSGGKASELDVVSHEHQGERMEENRPPRQFPSKEAEIIADLHERMLRDAERRGVIGPGWQ